MADKLIDIPIDDTQNYPSAQLVFETLDTQLFKPTNQNSLRVPKVVKPTNKKKHYHKTMRTSVINSPLSPPSLDFSLDAYHTLLLQFSVTLKSRY